MKALSVHVFCLASSEPELKLRGSNPLRVLAPSGQGCKEVSGLTPFSSLTKRPPNVAMASPLYVLRRAQSFIKDTSTNKKIEAHIRVIKKGKRPDAHGIRSLSPSALPGLPDAGLDEPK